MGVPNTTTFTLQDVVDEINPTTDDLQDCINDSVDALFDTRYKGGKTNLLNFRNYNGFEIDWIQSNNIYCKGDAGTGLIYIHTINGETPLQYSIDNGANWQSNQLFYVDVGTYYLKAKDVNNREIAYASNPVEITEPATAVTINSVSFSNVTVKGTNNGSITINASGGTGTLQYSIEGQWHANHVFDVYAGSYTIMVKDANSCVVVYVSNPVVITEPMLNDWFLPTIYELTKIANQFYHSVGDGGCEAPLVNNRSYWSSTELNATIANCYNLDVYSDGAKGASNYILPCRTFVAATGLHALKDIVISEGGKIFYITDLGGGQSRYYVASSEYTQITHVWSNVVDVLIGTTSASIGQGAANDLAIVMQSNHIDSAAKHCDNLVI